MSDLKNVVGRLYATLLSDPTLKRVTYYLAPNRTAKLTRQRKRDRRDSNETFRLTVGRPNYRERAFIKSCFKAKVKFPVANIQLQYYPKKRKK